MTPRRAMFYLSVLVCAHLGFPKSHAQIFIGDTISEGILWAPLPEPGDDSNIMDGEFSLLQVDSEVSGLGYDPDEKLVFWSVVRPPTISRIKLDGTNRETVISLTSPVEMALDLINGKIYWPSYTTQSIGWCDLDGGNDDTVYQYPSRAQPISIVVNPVEEFLLWSTRFPPAILKSGLDGSGRVTVADIETYAMVDEQCPDGITRVFYFSGTTLGVVNLDGSNKKVLKELQGSHGLSNTLNKYGNRLFWTSTPSSGNVIYEYDMRSSTLQTLNNTVRMADGSYRTIAPGTIRIFSNGMNVTYNEPVAIEGCPDSFIVYLNESNAQPVSWVEPTLNPVINCPSMELNGNITNGETVSTSDVKVFDLSYVASDSVGNTDVCRFKVGVVAFGRDLDQCEFGFNDCDANAMCTNIPAGSFICTCNEGYTGNGTTCTDIDECSLNTDNCDANAICTNTPAASFTCTCNEGYTGNGINCREELRPTTGAPTPNPNPAMGSSGCDGDQSGSGTTFFSTSTIVRTLGITFLFIITLK